MENKELELALQNARKLDFYIKKYRIETDLEYEKQEFENASPKLVGKSDNFFRKMTKKIGNRASKGSYEKHQEAYETKKKIYETLENKAKESNYYLDDENEAKQIISNLFINDICNVRKTEFLMSIILDNTISYEVNKTSYAGIEKLFGLSQDYMQNLEDKLVDAYRNISYGKSRNLNKAIIVGAAVAAPLIVSAITSGIGAAAGMTIGSALLYSTLGLPFYLAVASAGAVGVGLIAGYIIYDDLETTQKEKVKKDFKALNIDQTALSLSRTYILMTLVKDSDEPEAKRLYDSYVEEYLDLKSDCDLSLFKSHDDKDAAKKNDIFHNVDDLLKKGLNLA